MASAGFDDKIIYHKIKLNWPILNHKLVVYQSTLSWKRVILTHYWLNFKMVAMHYAKKQVFMFQLGLPPKASLWVKNAYSTTGIKICSLVCTRFPKTDMLSVQELRPTVGHKSCTESMLVLGNLVQTNDHILKPVLENAFLNQRLALAVTK